MPASPHRPGLVIFDCDGVLVDSERISHELLHRMLVAGGFTLTLDETVDRFIGTSPTSFVERLDEFHGGRAPDGFVETFRATRQELFARDLVAVPGVVEMLDKLAGPYCVASNGLHSKMAFTLAHTGLLSHFAGRIFSSEDVARPKPAPDLFLHAAATLGVAPRDCVVVEDTPTGIRAAKAAGMTAIGFSAMTAADKLLAAGADHVAPDMAALTRLL